MREHFQASFCRADFFFHICNIGRNDASEESLTAPLTPGKSDLSKCPVFLSFLPETSQKQKDAR